MADVVVHQNGYTNAAIRPIPFRRLRHPRRAGGDGDTSLRPDMRNQDAHAEKQQPQSELFERQCTHEPLRSKMQHQNPEYDSVPAESTQLVSRFKWWVVVATLVLTVVGGIGLTIILANGAANPPRAAVLIREMIDDAMLSAFGSIGDVELHGEESPLIAPFTIEMNASNNGASDSAWGIWLRVLDRENIQDWSQWWVWLVDNQGYMSTDQPLSWSEFLHIHPRNENTLSLQIEATGTTTFRINNEVAWTGELPAEHFQWGIAYYHNPQLIWGGIRLFGG